MNEERKRSDLRSFDADHGHVESVVIAFADSFDAHIFVRKKVDEGVFKASVDEEIAKSLGDFFSIVAGKCDGD